MIKKCVCCWKCILPRNHKSWCEFEKAVFLEEKKISWNGNYYVGKEADYA